MKLKNKIKAFRRKNIEEEAAIATTFSVVSSTNCSVHFSSCNFKKKMNRVWLPDVTFHLHFQVGNYVVATRNIDPVEVILEDSPAAYGPEHDTVPVCLECLLR